MNSVTMFWGNSEQKMFADEVKWNSINTMIIHFIRVDVLFLEKINNEIENRYYIHKINSHYQYIGNVISWNVIKIEKGFADLELVIKQCHKNKHIIFSVKNDVCSYLNLENIASEDLIKKINNQKKY